MRNHKLFSKFSRFLVVIVATASFLTLSQSQVVQPTSADTTPTITANAQNQNQTNQITDEQYRNASASQLAAMVRNGQVTPQELIRHAFNIISEDNPALNSVIYTREQQALAEASQLKDTGQPFYGVPILTKGLLQLIAGGPNANGLLPAKGTTISATMPVTKAFQNAGFIVIGLTNYPEMGLFNVTNSLLYGAASNPWNHDDNPGGSSGGAVASTADGMVPLAGGNDAGGSIRIPASWTGLIGLKPTQGIITGDSTTIGAVNFAETKTMQDTNALFESLLNPKMADQVQPAPTNLKDMPIAYSTKSPVGTPVSDDAVQAVQNAVAFLKSQGFNLVEVDAPVDGVKLMQAYYLAATSSGATANYIISTNTKQNMTFDEVNPMTWGLYQASKKLPADARTTYTNELNLISQQMTAFHQKYPLYLTPTTATTAPSNNDPIVLPEYAEQLKNSGNLSSDQQMQLIYDAWLHGLSKTPFTQLANMAGEPAISLPTYVSPAGMALGIQLEAGKYQDRLLLKIGELFEQHGLFKELTHQTTTPVPAPGSNNDASITAGSTTSSSATNPASVSPNTNPIPKTPVTVKNDAKVHPIVVYTLKKVYLHQSANFTKTNRIATYSKQLRPNRPMFLVTGYIRDHNGYLRYKVRDINEHTKNDGKQGYLTANDQFTRSAYYQIKPNWIKVINPKGLNEYMNVDLTRKTKHIQRGTVLKIKKIVTYHLTTRFVLQNGRIISANKKLVIVNK
ncbi:hypothetical protein YK48G_13510 [Lentilactobacillus fungorum]|uniref:Amidase n=1 Tax=Lentilactobacillus fungorum TaxID=2201250 RepID=A0ABQ3VZP7_9LACO|nr:amidase family protein [Lentilactobacillus fungorum]GHP13926.1 hypothetical protein YK48G_13510 [Lentilactobacillus fungorum]